MIRSPNAAIKDVLESFQNGTVLVIGDVMLDEYIAGKASRISPEAPVPIVEVEDRMLFPEEQQTQQQMSRVLEGLLA